MVVGGRAGVKVTGGVSPAGLEMLLQALHEISNELELTPGTPR